MYSKKTFLHLCSVLLWILVPLCFAEAKQIRVPWETRVIVANIDATASPPAFTLLSDGILASFPLHDSLKMEKGYVLAKALDEKTMSELLDEAADDYEKVLIAELHVTMENPPLNATQNELKKYLIRKKVPFYTVSIRLYDCTSKSTISVCTEKSRSRDLAASIQKMLGILRGTAIEKKITTLADPIDTYRTYVGIGATGMIPLGVYERYASYGGGLAVFAGVSNPWFKRQSVFVSMNALDMRPVEPKITQYQTYSLTAGTDYRAIIWKRLSFSPGVSGGYMAHSTQKRGLYFDPVASVSFKAMCRFPGGFNFLFIKPSYGWFFEKDTLGRFAQIEIGYQRRVDISFVRKDDDKEEDHSK